MAPRFEARQEIDGTWTVYDRLTQTPAIVNDVPQTGHAEVDARDLSRELDEILGDVDEDGRR